MATDATGTPTPKGIPKYNTTADAPSGLGFNATMDAIDLLLGWVKLRKNSGGADFERGRLNLIEGSNVTITVADDAGNNEVDVTFAASVPAWQAFTPTWTGTIGNGTITGRYVQVGKLTTGFVRVLWGSTTTHPAAVQVVGVPVAAALAAQLAFFVVLRDNSAGEFKGFTRNNTVNDVSVFSGGDATVAGTVTNTNPFTWTTNDELIMNFMYESV